MKQTSESLRYFLIISVLHFGCLNITNTQQKRPGCNAQDVGKDMPCRDVQINLRSLRNAEVFGQAFYSCSFMCALKISLLFKTTPKVFSVSCVLTFREG